MKLSDIQQALENAYREMNDYYSNTVQPNAEYLQQRIQEGYANKIAPWVNPATRTVQYGCDIVGLKEVADTMTGYGIILVSLTVLSGFPESYALYLIYFLYAGCFTSLINMVDSLLKKTEQSFLETPRRDYQAINTASFSFIFTLQAVIAVYLFIYSHAGENNKKVYISDDAFLLLLTSCVIPSVLSAVYNVWDNHKPIKNRVLNHLMKLFDFTVSASLTHDIIDAVYPADSTTYRKQLTTYCIALITAFLMLGINIKTPKTAETMTTYLGATNTLIFLTRLYERLNTDKHATAAEKDLLIVLWSFLLIMPVTFSLGVHAHKKYIDIRTRYVDLDDIKINTNEQDFTDQGASPTEETPLIPGPR